jgi:hypothetical protein
VSTLFLVLAAVSGTAAVLGAVFILGNIAARSPDKILWLIGFFLAFAGGAPLCWASVKVLVRTLKRPSANAVQ